MTTTNQHRLTCLTAALLLLPFFFLTACKELSNDPPKETGTLAVNLADIQKQVGVAATADQNTAVSRSVTVPGDSVATNEVKSLLVGAFVVTTRSTPYSMDVPITDAVEENVKDDLAASVDYIKIVDLPTADDTIEFSYPKSELSRWQVIAVALDFKIKEFAELGEDAHENSVLYMGFTDSFYTSSTIENVAEVSITMNRACLLNAVRGCATYGAQATDTPVVTSAVEILGVRYNGNSTYYTPTSDQFPYIVRDSNATAAASYLGRVRDEIATTLGGAANIRSLTVVTTHTGNSAESAACRALYASSSPSRQALTDACAVQANKISY